MLVSFPLSHWDKIFGLYYHSLLIHGPVQYEIVCLCSVNTEANERMFNSVKVVADQCTNRHPDNVVMKVLLHVQSKQIQDNLIGGEGSLKNQSNTQDGYNGHCAVGDLRRQMAGISNICHLRHDSRQCDCTIKSFGRQTSREMTCFMELK